MDEKLFDDCSLEEYPDDIEVFEAERVSELMNEGLIPPGYTGWNTLRIETLRGLICLYNREIARLHHHLYHPNASNFMRGRMYTYLKRKEKHLLARLRVAQNLLRQKSGES
jgi:hypothetical protein